MQRLFWGLALVLSAACLTVPPEQPPPENPRKATAMVDSNGRIVEGGNLTLDIPAGAIPQGERVQVTIDEIRGAPGRHVNDAYLVGPEGYSFLKDVTVTYRYSDHMVRDVVDPEVLFIGVAQGQSWRRLNAAQNDADAGKAWGQVAHFSVFGLVDRNMQGDGGIILDGGAPDQPSQDRDAGRPDLLGQDLTGRDISVADAGSSGMQVQLTWDVPNADLDLHLYRVGVGPFTDGDCYYANCKANPLDWPPSGAANNPAMDIDDINGFGPENINMVQPDSGDYVAAIHLYNRQGDELPFNYTLRVYQYDQLLIEVTRPVTVCDELASVINIAIASGQVTVSERSDPSSTGGSGVCP